jgi:hypothetical protein
MPANSSSDQTSRQEQALHKQHCNPPASASAWDDSVASGYDGALGSSVTDMIVEVHATEVAC